MKYSVLMPYYDRKTLYNTLMSFKYHYGNRRDYEVIIIEDQKNTDEKHKDLLNIINVYSNCMNIQYYTSNFEGFNPTPSFNYASSKSSGEYLIITNPECFHVVNIIGELDKIYSVSPNSYVLCACINVLSISDQINDFNKFEFIPARMGIDGMKDIPYGDILQLKDVDSLKTQDQLDWYQHSIYHNRGLHFCSSISKRKYQEISGFDEKYNQGIGWEDNDFINKIRLGNIEIIYRDDLLVFHQFHKREYHRKNMHLNALNRKFYNEKWSGNLYKFRHEVCINENNRKDRKKVHQNKKEDNLKPTSTSRKIVVKYYIKKKRVKNERVPLLKPKNKKIIKRK